MRVTLPKELRAKFEEIAADVAKKANATYRKGDHESRRASAGHSKTGTAGGVAAARGGSVASIDARRDASIRLIRRIVRVLEEELGNQPRLLRRLLLALAKIDPIFAAELRTSTKAS